MDTFRELPAGARQMWKRSELASEQHAEPQYDRRLHGFFTMNSDRIRSRQRRILTVTAGGYKTSEKHVTKAGVLSRVIKRIAVSGLNPFACTAGHIITFLSPYPE